MLFARAASSTQPSVTQANAAKAISAALDNVIPSEILALQVALHDIREERIALVGKRENLILRHRAGRLVADEISAADLELKKIDEKIGDAMRALAAAREAFTVRYYAAMSKALKTLNPNLADAVKKASDVVDAARGYFGGAYQHATRNGFSPPNILTRYLGCLPGGDLKSLAAWLGELDAAK
jgi:hypothetical protein